MFRAIIDAFNFTSGAEEPTEDVPNTKEDIDEDGWVNFELPEDSEEEAFAVIENPEIMEMGDNETVIAPLVSRKISPEMEAIKKREEFNQAKAKTAFRNHLESVMFSDPISGKDIRTQDKSSNGSSRSSASNGSNSIRRLNTQSQRSKKSSGKSNDRKTHRISDLQMADV